jgi:hypothetical protein
VIPCSSRLCVVLVERVLFEFVYKVNGECSFGECMCLCSFDRKYMYMLQALVNEYIYTHTHTKYVIVT